MAKRKKNRGWFARKMWEELGADIEEEGKKALEEGAKIVVADAKSRVNIGPNYKGHDPGALRKSIRYIKLSKGRLIKIIADAKNEKGVEYGQYVEWDPSIAKPFLEPAKEANKAQVKQMIIDAIKRGIDQNAQKS